MLTNDLGILRRLLGYAQSGRFGAVYLLLRGDCNILCFFLCGVIQIGLVSGTAVLFGFTDHPIIEKSIGVKIVAGSGEAKGFEIEVKVKVEHIDLVEQLVVDPLGEFGNAVVGQAVELDRFFVGVCYDAGYFLHAEPNGGSITGMTFNDDTVAVDDQRHRDRCR